jgi:hypothetical protein
LIMFSGFLRLQNCRAFTQLPPQQRLRLRFALLDCRTDLLLRGGSQTGTGESKQRSPLS